MLVLCGDESSEIRFSARGLVGGAAIESLPSMESDIWMGPGSIKREKCMKKAAWFLTILVMFGVTDSMAQVSVGGSVEVEAAPPATSSSIPGKVSRTESELRPDVMVREELVRVSTDDLDYTFTNHGGTLRHAILRNEKYTRDELRAIDGAPEHAYKGGQIDLVSTWHPSFLPFRLSFESVEIGIRTGAGGSADFSEGNAKVTRVVRRSASGQLEEGTSLVDALSDSWAVDHMVLVGDTLRVLKVPALSGERYTVKKVIGKSRVVLDRAVEGLEGEFAYEIYRLGSFRALFEADPVYTRVSETVGLPLTYIWPDPRYDTSDIYIEKTFHASEQTFQLRMDTKIYNFSPHQAQYLSRLDISAWMHPDQGESRGFVRPTDIYAASCYTGDSLEREEFPSLSEEEQPIECKFDTSWIGVDTVYFIAAAAPNKSTNRRASLQAWAKTGALRARLIHPSMTLPSGERACTPDWLDRKDHNSCASAYKLLDYDPKSGANLNTYVTRQKDHAGGDAAQHAAIEEAYQSIRTHRRSREPTSYVIYTGPKDPEFLATAGSHMEAAMDYGYLSFIAEPLHGLLRWFFSLVGHWGFAIILLTILVKLSLLPLTQKSFMAMQKMQKLKPELDKLKKEYGDDKQAFNKAMFALYKRHKVNPLGGCLPMLLQMPIWISLYQTIANAVELYHTPLGLWIQDLSASDPYYIMPFIMGGLMIVQNSISGSTATMDGMQAKIMKWGMPIMFTGFMLFLPSGLVLYILVNTLLTIAQNLYIRRGLEK